MIPYTSFLYFGVLLYVAVPTFLVEGISRRRLRQFWILAVTAIMLVLQYWIPTLWLVAAYAMVEWGGARAFVYLRQRRGKHPLTFYAFIALALVPLVYVKVIPLVQPDNLIGFLGVSYVSFRVIDVVINIQDGLIKELPPASFFAFILFFPTISSGPIDRYRRFLQDWRHERTRTEFVSDLDKGINYLFRGFLYKFILGFLINRFWLVPASQYTGFKPILSYMYAYSFYLFFDFAGYSAFAIGLSYFLGIHTPENFNRPFFSRNIREFWERWHISLSLWFRDHVYSRFVYTAVKNKWFTSKSTISYLGYFVSFGLMGFWHGLTWYYILYGFYHASLMTGYDVYHRWKKQRGVTSERWPMLRTCLSVFITFNLVCLGLLLFSGRLDPHFVPTVS